MSGKLTVFGLLLMGVAVFVYGVYFISDTTPVSERFDMRRDVLESAAPGPLILKEKIGNFQRESFTPLEADANGVDRGSATYHELDTKRLTLSVERVGTRAAGLAQLSALAEKFRTTTVPLALALRPEGAVPYLYVAYNTSGTTHHEFVWLNGEWMLRVFTDEADAEALLRLVNNYPF